MRPQADGSAPRTTLLNPLRFHVRKLLLLALCAFSTAWAASAQTVTWSASYTQGQAPSQEQRDSFTGFQQQLSGKNFSSVRIWGTKDPVGIKLTDPSAASELARLLSSTTPGSVTSDGRTWVVTACDNGNGFLKAALSVDGNASFCDCADKNALRPYSTNGDWGGLNSLVRSCGSESQTISLEFHSGVTVIPAGPTTICNGEAVELSVQSEVCTGNLTYQWSTGEITPTIRASASGSYWVSVLDPVTGCSGTSAPVYITTTNVNLTVGIEGTNKFCTEPVQLKAAGTSTGGLPSGTPHNFCFVDENSAPVSCGWVDNDACDDWGVSLDGFNSYSTTVSIEDPMELQYKLYYYTYARATFVCIINEKEVARFEETITNGNCSASGSGEPNQVISIPQDILKGVWLPGQNTIRIEVISNGGLYLIGLSADIVKSNVTYRWSPVTGLNNPNIADPKASPGAAQLYTVTYTDANGCQASGSVQVEVGCPETSPLPVASCAVLEVALEAGCTVTKTAKDFDNGSHSPGGLALIYTIAPAGPFGVGTTPVTLTVTDTEGQSSSCTTTITVTDGIPPAIEAPIAITVPTEPGTCSATVLLEFPLVSDNCGGTVVRSNYVDQSGHANTVFPQGTTVVTWTATDASGNVSTATQEVIVTNIAPVITSISLSGSPVPVNTPVTLGVSFTDDNAASASVDWGDGSGPEQVLSPLNIFEVAHTYESAGEYTVSVSISDLCGAVVNQLYGPILAFDRFAGSVSGGGWFESPAGAYTRDPRAAGRASFSFEAEYARNSNLPVGSAGFNFKAGNLKFRSTSLRFLFINGDVARLISEGKLNGRPGYQLLISMVDDDTKPVKINKRKSLKSDRIRVKISDPDGVVIYDNQGGAPHDAIASTRINSGSIEIDSKAFELKKEDLSPATSSFGEETTSVYPNPFVDYLNIQYSTESGDALVVRLMDLGGRVVASAVFPVSADGSYSVNIPDNVQEGIYLLTIKQGKKVTFLNVVRK